MHIQLHTDSAPNNLVFAWARLTARESKNYRHDTLCRPGECSGSSVSGTLNALARLVRPFLMFHLLLPLHISLYSQHPYIHVPDRVAIPSHARPLIHIVSLSVHSLSYSSDQKSNNPSRQPCPSNTMTEEDSAVTFLSSVYPNSCLYRKSRRTSTVSSIII